MQVIGKIDEAGTHDADYMVMGGYAARLGQWNRFDIKWKKALRKSGLEYFHTKEHFNHPFAVKAPKISEDHLWFGFVTRLDKADYKKFYREGGWGGKIQPDSMYGLCFRFCLGLVLERCLLEMQRDDLVINFVTEEGHVNAGAPAEMMRQIKRKRISGISEYLGQAVTGEKKKVPGLQAADGVATGAWQLEKVGPSLSVVNQRAPTKELAQLSNTKCPIFHTHLNEGELKQFKEGFFQHHEHRRQWGLARAQAIAAATADPFSGEQSS